VLCACIFVVTFLLIAIFVQSSFQAEIINHNQSFYTKNVSGAKKILPKFTHLHYDIATNIDWTKKTMSKKDRKQKRDEAQKKKTDILESEIVGDETEETLLGNLARVKSIPMIPWDSVPAMPTFEKVMPMPISGTMNDWYQLFVDVSENEDCDLIGITPIKAERKDFAAIAPGSIGMAVQVLKVEKTDANMALLYLKGICRYENIGFLPAPEPYFNIKIRWFEDEFEPEEIVRPHFEKHLKILEKIAKIVGESMKYYKNVSETAEYDFRATQYGSFMLLNTPFNLFTADEQLELFKLTSTSERLKRVNQRVELVLPLLEKKENERRKGKNN
jgi:Lon protease-like protein